MIKNYIAVDLAIDISKFGVDVALPRTTDRSVFCIIKYDSEKEVSIVLETGILEGKTPREIDAEIEELKRTFNAVEFNCRANVALKKIEDIKINNIEKLNDIWKNDKFDYSGDIGTGNESL